jgi:ribulose 1,5-bisphosphate carboxylase large subunit-like protein
MIDKTEDPASEMDFTVHALRMASAITSNASEPAAVIANAEPIAVWLTIADEQADLRRRLAAAYQQLENQRGAGCEVGLFLGRAEELYTFLCQVDTATRPVEDAARDRQNGDA